MRNQREDAAAIAIIGSADGPTAIIMSGQAAKLPLRSKIRKRVYQIKRLSAEKRNAPGTHSLRDVAAYAMDRYQAIQADHAKPDFIVQKNILKEYLLFRKKTAQPDAPIKDHEIPMDFQIYEIRQNDNRLEIAIDFINESFGISYCGSKKAAKQFKLITRDLYTYYGVSEEDIQNKTERYLSLLSVLSR